MGTHGPRQSFLWRGKDVRFALFSPYHRCFPGGRSVYCKPKAWSEKDNSAKRKDAGGDGKHNVGRYGNPKMDALVDRIKRETDDLIRKKNVSLVHRADNRVDIRWVKVE